MFKNNLNTTKGFDLFEDQYIAEQSITTGSNYMFGNGYMGYRGTHPDDTKEDYVATIVTDTYDKADGKWRELCNAPNGLYTSIRANGQKVSPSQVDIQNYKRSIELDHAILVNEFANDVIAVEVERFASMDQLHGLVMSYKVSALEDGQIEIVTGIDGDVWSINGDHYSKTEFFAEKGCLYGHARTKEFDIELNVSERMSFVGGADYEETLIKSEDRIMRHLSFQMKKGMIVEVHKYVTIYSSNDVDQPIKACDELGSQLLAQGYDQVKERHCNAWNRLWQHYDIKIDGSLRDQTLTRFNLYHNIIHTPTHALLPVGARGLSCQAYQGAAFWDQEIFNMPMYLYTNPEVAKNILMYRYQTIDGARTKAKKLGYRGAFYAWISGKSGEELCPDFFFKDIITGRKIRNHFNDWQIHVSSDIAYTIWRYYEVTDDKEFLLGYGAEMMLDIALFLMTRSFYNVDKRRYEFIRLLGPDEYHENVDNNVFTNYQARYTLQKTMMVCEELLQTNPDKLEALLNKLEITKDNLETFKDIIEKIYIKEANEDKVIEQFDHYFDLEDIMPHDLAERLIDKAEYWGWPNGIAVHTQVLKQADLIQLFVMHDDFDDATLKANYDYYEPRTEHGSSLSPAMHAIIASKIGYKDQAYEYFTKSCTVDLYNANKPISGGTFIGGIHTASCGAVWQMMIFGFAGFSVYDNVLHFRPTVPEAWDGYHCHLHHHHNYVDVHITKTSMEVTSKVDNNETLQIEVGGQRYNLDPGKSIMIHLNQVEMV